MNTTRLQHGFTLIELLIVLALVTLLMAVALPSYDAYVRRAHRTEARAALLQAAHRLEREATATGAYPKGELPPALATVPGGRYRIARLPSASDLEATTRFSLRAIPLGPQAQDDCGVFTLSSTGERGLAENRASVADCWHR